VIASPPMNAAATGCTHSAAPQPTITIGLTGR
jgi:hypothetical protein